MKLDNTYGNSCHSVALSTILKYYGYPFSEEMCFGLGGAYDFIASDMEFGFHKKYTIVSGNNENDFYNISGLFNFRLQIYQPLGEQELKSLIYEKISEGVPLIAKVSINQYMKEIHSSSTHRNEEALEIFRLINSSVGNHVTVVNNIGADKVSIIEPNIFEPVIISWKNFYRGMFPADKTVNHPARTLYTLKPEKTFAEIEKDMKHYITKAIRENMEIYLEGNGCWNGLHLIDKLYDILFNQDDANRRMVNAKIFRFFCDITTGGGFYRRLYANFLKEANKKYLQNADIAELATCYNRICKSWTGISKIISVNYKELNEEKLLLISEGIKRIAGMERETAEKLLERVGYGRIG